jgi:hypothetical protein
MNHQQQQTTFEEAFVQRLLKRRGLATAQAEATLEGIPRPERPQSLEELIPELKEALQSKMRGYPERESVLEGRAAEAAPPREMVLETIVNIERPVLFVRDHAFDTREVTILGPEAKDLVRRMETNTVLKPYLPLVGRIDVENFPANFPFVGSAWFVDEDIVVTNRHVASLIAEWDDGRFIFSPGTLGRTIEASFNNAHEYDDAAPPDPRRIRKIKRVLYIEPEPGPDIAFVQMERGFDGAGPRRIEIADADVGAEVPVCVVGYPARAPRRIIPDQEEMERLYRGQYDVKRAAPGYSMAAKEGLTLHDCTTLGGASGSVVFDLKTGRAVGLHFAGLYHEENYAVRASILNEYISGKKWNSPVRIETAKPPQPPPDRGAQPQKPASSSAPPAPATQNPVQSVTFPLTVTLSLGPAMNITAVAAGGPATPAAAVQRITAADVEKAAADYWRSRPEGVVAVRVGFIDQDGKIGDQPCIAASVLPSRLAALEAEAPTSLQGVPIRYLPATADEQLESLRQVEAVSSVAYDDENRRGEGFSFEQVEEEMEVTLHVGPEYSWEVLSGFLKDASGQIVSAMYEFHSGHIKDAIEARLRDRAALSLVLDNATFSEDDEFDPIATFDEWARRFNFKRIIAPEGSRGLIANSYHIKVTVREDDTFWLSSGNWKSGSSQPVISEAQRRRADAGEADLPGNREWHIVVKNPTLAARFRNHIQQDFARSEELGGRTVPRSRAADETFIDVPIEEAVVLERPAPDHIIEPKTINGVFKVRPLLTPDSEGAVYSKAVLRLIRSARRSLLFQIPYIGMPPNPNSSRGFIDDLIGALVEKLLEIEDARVILRSGGKEFSNPTHAAWFFKSKGVDIEQQLRVIENHHTKGMIVDGTRVLIGSHNWSAPGVTLNRDASLLFDDERVASYYAEAFEIDWKRASEIRPRQFVRREAAILEAVGSAPAPGYKRVALSAWLKDD